MPDIINGYYFDVGQATNYQDWGAVKEITHASGDRLSVAVLAASGVGGSQLATMTAVDSVFHFLNNEGNQELPVNGPNLLIEAAKFANQTVLDLDLNDYDGCSLVIAVIVNGRRLFVANVGRSGIFFVRKTKLTPMSMLHTPEKEAVLIENFEADPFGLLGVNDEVNVDVGFHLGQTDSFEDYQEAQERGREGLALRQGDSVLVCNHGQILQTNQNGSLILPAEAVQVLTSQEGQKAARALVSFALGRDAETNVAIATLQTEDPKRAVIIENAAAKIRRRTAAIYSGVTLLATMCILLSGWLMFSRNQRIILAANQSNGDDSGLISISNDSANQNAEAQYALSLTIQAEEFEVMVTQTVAAILTATEDARPTATPEPTITPRPTLQPGQIGFYRFERQDEPDPVYDDDSIFASDEAEVQINHEGIEAEDLSIYAWQGSELDFNGVRTQVDFRLFEESDVFVETGFYEDGVEIEVRAIDEDVVFNGENACLAVNYTEEEDEEELVASCFRGTCSYRIDRGESVTIPAGRQFVFNPADLSERPRNLAISSNTAAYYQGLLNRFDGGVRDAQRCIQSFLPATPTPTATPTIFVPTPTPLATPAQVVDSSGVTATAQPPRPTQDPTATPTPLQSVDPILANTATATPTKEAASTATSTRLPTNVPSQTPTVAASATSTPSPEATSTTLPTRTPRPTSTPRPTRTPVPTSTFLPTSTPTTEPTQTATAVPPTSTPTFVPTATQIVIPTDTPEPKPTATVEIKPTETPEPLPTETPIVEPTDTPVPEPTDTPEPEPTATLEVKPTDTPEPLPTDTPVPEPTDTPEPKPTDTPVPGPTSTPEPLPTDTPEPKPTEPVDDPVIDPPATPVPDPTEPPEPPDEEEPEV
ncbi:MAG: hypothetical protein AAGD96_06160 [Chloroflexota bacterium]